MVFSRRHNPGHHRDQGNKNKQDGISGGKNGYYKR
ncbi:hypothetical protein LTSEMIN_6352, partial [Salmonella enterica subsp. enterica serovar Minnesota str. A4-603]